MTRLHDLLPAALRRLDEARGGPLRDLLDLLGDTLDQLDEDLAQAHDDLFIETCAEWAIPYIGELVGHRPLRGPTTRLASPRAEVARTLGYRRRKGTAAVLEQISRDISGRPARVVESWQQLALSQHQLHLRPHLKQSPDVRRARDHHGPFATTSHTVDVRTHQPYNLPDITVFVWRLRALPLARVTPARLEDQTLADGRVVRRYTFSPTGDPVPLFNRPSPAYEGPLTAPIHAPTAISRRQLFDDLAAYYGDGNSLCVRLADTLVDINTIDAADLSDDPTDPPRWSRGARPGRIAIDPVLGRLAVDASLLTNKPALEVSFHVGAADELGGGQYERTITADDLSLGPGDDITAGLGRLPQNGTLELRTSHTYALKPLILDIPAGQRITIRAAQRERPLLIPIGAIQIRGGDGSELILDGLVIAGALDVPADSALHRLTLRHCTLIPGLARTPTGQPLHPNQPSLTVAAPSLRVHLEACITGPLRLPASAVVDCTRCILDAASPTATVYASADDMPAGALSLDRCTVLGKLHAESLGLVTNSILLGPVRCDRRQSGCVRHSFIAPGSSTPRRHQCLPDDGAGPFAPRFHALRYGHPQYALLRPDAPPRLRAIADDEAEPGVYHDLLLPLIEANLRTRLAEHLRLGLTADLSFVT